MRISACLLALALLVVPVAAGEFGLVFAEPGQLGGNVSATQVQWMIGALAPGGSISVEWTAPASLTNTTIVHGPSVSGSAGVGYTGQPRSLSEDANLGIGGLRLIPRTSTSTFAAAFNGKASVSASANMSLIGATSSDATMSRLTSTPAEAHDYSYRMMSVISGTAVSVDGDNRPNLNAVRTGATFIEWFDMDVECFGNLFFCPDGGGFQENRVPVGPAVVGADAYRFQGITGATSMALSGPVSRFAAGGAALDLLIDGSIHLPRATTSGCDPCPEIQDQTLYATGLLELNNITPTDEGFTATLQGDFTSVRLDEEWVSPERLGQIGTAAAAAIGIGLLIKFLVAPLFTRLTKAESLEHPRRKAIFEYVQQHPGANFREIARQTHIAAGTVRHHLTILERAGHLVEHAHLGTVRLFENHGKFDHNWSDLVLLREPPLAVVHDWLRDHPQSPQKNVLEAMEQTGWSRSTTQHRLSRLVDGGLVTIRLQGRLKIYNLAPRPAKPVVGLAPFTVPRAPVQSV